MSDQPYTYDETLYPSSSFPQSHPVKIATMAKLFGLAPADPARCRVLELGAADGSNILPLAQQYPNSTFEGVDLSSRTVALAKAAIEAAALKNVSFAHQNILDFQTAGKEFDYIVVHGIYSWVPDTVRAKILEICKTCLAPQGVAYISYNALPGWRMRGMLRDMIVFHTAQFPDAPTKIAQARALVKFLSESVPTENNPYGQFIKNELELMKSWQDGYLRHDLLEEENTPFYFHEFVGQALRNDLQYLAEPELASMLATGFPQAIQETLQKVGRNIIAMEQYMDFVRNRMFRQTLLVRKDLKLNRSIPIEVMRDCWFTTSLRPVSAEPSLAPGAKEEFKSPTGGAITTDNNFIKAVFTGLSRVAPNQMSFAELVADVRTNLLGAAAAGRDPKVVAQEEGFICHQLMQFYSRGVLEVTSFPFPTVEPAGEKPNVSALARHQAMHCRVVANSRHVSLGVDIFSRHLMSLLDGTRDRAALLTGILEKVAAGSLTVQSNGQPIKDEAILKSVLEPRITSVLEQLSKLGYFVRPS